MYAKLCMTVVAALAAASQAKPHDHEGMPKYHPSAGYPGPFGPHGPYPTAGGAGPAPFPTGGPAPLPTRVPGPGSPGSGPSGSGEDVTTLTYTVGSGDHTSVVTTTIYRTRTHTNYHVSRLCPTEQHCKSDSIIDRLRQRKCYS